VGRLPFLLIHDAPFWASTSEDFLAGLGKVILNCSALPYARTSELQPDLH
jgi:hypothetical protein